LAKRKKGQAHLSKGDKKNEANEWCKVFNVERLDEKSSAALFFAMGPVLDCHLSLFVCICHDTHFSKNRVAQGKFTI
jgi:hypothetical protein